MSKPNSGLFKNTKGDRCRRLIPGENGIVTGGNSTKLGKNLLQEMGIAETKWSGYQAQHIIPSQMSSHPVIQKIGMDLDHASNGMFLKIPGNNISPMSRHKGFHSVYSDFVREKLNSINISQDSLTIQQQVRNLQIKLKYLQKIGLPLYASEGATLALWRKYYNKLNEGVLYL